MDTNSFNLELRFVQYTSKKYQTSETTILLLSDFDFNELASWFGHFAFSSFLYQLVFREVGF